MLSGASKAMHVAIWSLALLLAGAVAACPIMACPIAGATPAAGDDCCPKSTHSSSHCPSQTPSDCPYLVVEKSLLSKSANAGPVVAASTIAVLASAPVFVAPIQFAAPAVEADLSDTYLQIRVLRI